MAKLTNGWAPSGEISLGIHPVWSESLLCAEWVAKDPSLLHADTEDSDPTGRMPIFFYSGNTCHCVGFVMRWLKSRSLHNMHIFTVLSTFFEKTLFALRIISTEYSLFWLPYLIRNYLSFLFECVVCLFFYIFSQMFAKDWADLYYLHKIIWNV